jgi:branched-chain amino acid transport system ATP-binding protein
MATHAASSSAALPSSDRPILALRKVSKNYGGVTALSDVTLDLAPHEALGVIGPNGAGKSTLLSLVSGALPPSTGEIEFLGRRIDRLSAHRAARLGIGRARQIPRPFPRMTVRQNLEVGANSAIHDDREREAFITETLQYCGLLHRQHSLAGSLPLLDLKRLEIARALSLRPKLLLLDEVAGGLVGAEVDAVMQLIAGLRARGTTIILVEHVQALIQKLADRTIVLDWGRVIAEGTPAEVARDQRVMDVYFGHAAEPSTTAKTRPAVAAARLLDVGDACVAYGGLQALNSVDLTVGAGEIVGIIGANGAGKTTLCRAIAGLVPLSTGTISFGGKSIAKQPAHLRARGGIAICHEGRRLFGGLTVLENLELGAAFSGASRPVIRERMARIFQLFPILEERKDGPAGAMSGGQQQMLAVGRALMSEPKLLLLDELSLGLAPQVIERIYEVIEQIRAWGVSVLLVEQNTHRALATVDRVYVLEKGRISYAGDPAGLMSNETLRRAYFGEAQVDG